LLCRAYAAIGKTRLHLDAEVIEHEVAAIRAARPAPTRGRAEVAGQFRIRPATAEDAPAARAVVFPVLESYGLAPEPECARWGCSQSPWS
jgi:hypothetical protein